MAALSSAGRPGRRHIGAVCTLVRAELITLPGTQLPAFGILISLPAEYLRPSFRLAEALQTLRLSSSVRWQQGLHRAGCLVRPDFTP